ncbi:TPA: PD-(D/E)XK nuclease-like domain-containing protein [Klebsiella pneumoniae]|nr:PD-(D/E)XK nuclease-like domain-containing protein [Klebsiella pneumoniae]
MEYFYLIKATQKSGKADAIIWRSAKSEARAQLQLDVDLEDAEIETGRGKDYQKPIRTDFPVFNDLPAEGVIDYSWCERYQLADDQRTWQIIPGATDSTTVVEGEIVNDDSDDNGSDDADNANSGDENSKYNIAEMPFRIQLLAQYMAEEGHVYHISVPHRSRLSAMEMDTDNSSIQDLILSTENEPEIKKFDMPSLWKYTSACKKVFPEGKRHELGKRIEFAKLWVKTAYVDRGILVKEWASGNRVTAVQRTDAGTNAGGGNKTDRNPDYVHTLDTLDQEIALATLPMDFDIYDFPGSIHRRAKEIIAAKESPWKEWSVALRSVPGILDYSRAAIFAMIRGAGENVHHFPDSLRRYINSSLTESVHDKPSAETIAAACHSSKNDSDEEVGRQLAASRGEYVEGISDPNEPKWVHEDLTNPKQPEIAKVSAGMYSIEGLMGNPSATSLSIVDQVRQNTAEGKIKAVNNEEATSHVQMEETQQVKDEVGNSVPAGESANADAEKTDPVNMREILEEHCPDLTAAVLKERASGSAAGEDTAKAEPETTAPAWPEFFEPGRYEGVPNEVYHAANGISSTQIKDARISLMYFHARHVAKTIARESTDALTFGSLVHALALEPEKFDEEFAVFPGVPAGAFTNTDTLKAFIRDYNVDKAKADQLKLTGKKEELQEAIRAVNPDAIFADEFEQEWNESNRDKTIISATQLSHAKTIQQALFNHPTAGKLLTHPSRAVEVSYFGIDEETGLEVRVRPDLEIDMGGLRIGGDLKSITVGKIKQEALRARLHREIIDRDYHLSAAMYCDVATFDQFYWIFVNKDENYHWIAIIEASEELLELGMLEYRKAMRAIANGFDTGEWPAPITEDYTEELNDFDVRRLEALRAQA